MATVQYTAEIVCILCEIQYPTMQCATLDLPFTETNREIAEVLKKARNSCNETEIRHKE